MNARVALLLLAFAVLTPFSGCRRDDAAPPTASRQLYQCSMHPQIVSDRPGTCPICGMQLRPVEPAHVHGAHGPAEGPAPTRAPFSLSTERQQLIGVRRGRVDWQELVQDIRAVGRVAYDPALYNAIVEYREAVAARRTLAASDVAEATRSAEAIVRAAALKLRQRGLSEEQLRSLDRDPVNLLLPGTSAWVYAQVYEFEVALVRPGQEVTVTAPSAPGRAYSGRVASVDPLFDAATRTARVRVLVTAPEADLLPEAFVTARIHVHLGRRLAVPKEAILFAGEQQVAFVVHGEGTFEPRPVTLGREAEDAYEVLAGLEAGDEVVTSANFLIDSESRFRAALETFGAPPAGHVH
jgi:Cu(I)/Ag(I) efflux system membrane fusion protein